MRRVTQLFLLVVCIAAAFFFAMPQLVDEAQNKVLNKPPYPASEPAVTLHKHASAKTIEDVLAVANRPVVVSHTGVKGTCDNNRNLSDDQIRAVASKGGLIGIGYWDTATCGTDAHAIVKAMRYVSDRVGVEHVALGSDFDGAVTEPFDTSGLVEITGAMLEAGYSEQEIRMIMGENALKFLAANLPER